MRVRRRLPLLFALSALGAGVAGAQQPLPEFELGYRFVDVSGNESMYRTMINDRPGVLLRSLSWNSTEPLDGIFDFAHVDASDIGAGPAGQLRLTAGQVDTYRLDFSWRRTKLFSELPALANPFLDDGIIPGQHTHNRTRNIYDATLEIFPGQKWTPILGYTRNEYEGPGQTTYQLGEDEFALDQNVDAVDEEYRVGLGFDVGPVRGALIQGWRRFRWSDTESLRSGAENGNNPGPVLGQPVTADRIDRTTDNETDTPVTSFWITGNPITRLKLVGSFVLADATAETTSVESDAGNFVSFQVARFFAGLDDSIRSSAETDYWRGSLRAEFNLMTGIDISGGWAQKSRELEGEALIRSLYLDTATFGGTSLGDLLQEIEDDTSVEREDRNFDISGTARLIGRLSVNAGFSKLDQDVTFQGGDDDVLAEPGEEFSRTVDTYGAGLTWSGSGLTIGADYRHDDANRPIFRTDFLDRDRLKFRVTYAWKDFVRVGGTWRESRAENDIPEIGFLARVKEIAGDLEVGPIAKILTVRFSAGEFRVDRDIRIRVPEDFSIETTTQNEIGHTYEGGIGLVWKRLLLDASYLWMENDGSIPFTIDRVRARAEYGIGERTGLVFEWMRDEYDEAPAFDQAGPLADFNANRYGIYVHFRP